MVSREKHMSGAPTTTPPGNSLTFKRASSSEKSFCEAANCNKEDMT
jgi:hypothetical protein